MIFQDLPVYDFENIGMIKTGFSPSIVTIQNQTGLRGIDRRRQTPVITGSFSLNCNSRSKVVVAREFLDYCCGRLNPFWLPDWARQIRIAGTVAAPATVIPFIKTDFIANYTKPVGGLSNMRKALYFFRHGDPQVRAIASYQAIDADTEELTLSTALPDDPLTPDSYERICFLNFARLDADRIESTWQYGTAVFLIPFRIIEYGGLT